MKSIHRHLFESVGRYSFLPQQAIVPSVRSPQVWPQPDSTCWKVPDGASDCPTWLSPQQTAVPSVRTPHMLPQPADTCLKVPESGLVGQPPQQTTVPSVLRPQPAVTCLKVPDGGLVSPS